MHFAIDRKRLIRMIELVRRARPGTRRKPSARMMRIYACASRVFVEANGMTVGEETMVLQDGGCLVPIKRTLELLKFHPRRENVLVAADRCFFTAFSHALIVKDYTADVKPPADFVVGRVTDTWLSSPTQV